MDEWINIVEKKQKEYMIKLYSKAIAYTIFLWKKYTTEKININLIYNDIIESTYNFNNTEENIIKKEALNILKSKYKCNYEKYN